MITVCVVCCREVSEDDSADSLPVDHKSSREHKRSRSHSRDSSAYKSRSKKKTHRRHDSDYSDYDKYACVPTSLCVCVCVRAYVRVRTRVSGHLLGVTLYPDSYIVS